MSSQVASYLRHLPWHNNDNYMVPKQYCVLLELHTVITYIYTVRTLFSGLRLILFLFEGYLVTNQLESVLKMFLKLVSEILLIIYY